MKLIKLKLVSFIFLMAFGLVAQKTQTENIILISVDGLRWQEVFQGVDSTLNKDKKFWSEKPSQSRKELMPFFWGTISDQGQLYGNRNLDNKVNLRNVYWFSYPGRSETLCGYYDPKIDSNVLRPMIMQFPIVVRLKYLRSSGRCQGKLLFRPITMFSSMAQINDKYIS